MMPSGVCRQLLPAVDKPRRARRVAGRKRWTEIIGLALVLPIVAVGCATDSGTGDGRDTAPRRGMRGVGQGARPAPEPAWKGYDLNGDGKVTRAEFMAVRGVCFARYDAKGDGLLTLAAIQRRFPPDQAARIAAEFRRIDVDGDSLVTREEWDKESERLFRQLDTNNDGILAGSELLNLSPTIVGILCSEGTGTRPTNVGRSPG